MNEKPLGNQWAQLKFMSAQVWSTLRSDRYDRYRSQVDGERLVAEPVSHHARNLVVQDLSLASRQLAKDADEQQRVALSAWEDEGGKVKLSAVRLRQERN